jgi:gamma-glutamylcyclotransferase (GGCT)/AIG2-like uncharacterized protein YtfP
MQPHQERYFAYGSNMNWSQMTERCPSAKFVTTALLLDHQLSFTRLSKTRGCGVADAVHEIGATVWGVVYDISEEDLSELDKREGFKSNRKSNSYSRQTCVVSIGGDEGRPLNVWTYFAERQPNPPPPNQGYKDLIVSGARHWHLPDDYIEQLDRIQVRG